MQTIQIIILLFALFALSRVLLKIKREKTSWKKQIPWLIVWLALILFTLWPATSSYLAALLQVSNGINLLLYISIVVLFYLIYRLYVKIDSLDQTITHLVRELAKRNKSKIQNNKDNLGDEYLK